LTTRNYGNLSRRNFLKLLGLLAFSYSVPQVVASFSPKELAENPFRLGVASGDPDATSVILWTRLVSSQLPKTGAVSVNWQLFSDPEGKHLVLEGVAVARAELA
jgi:alkaline phosphatase D